MLEMFKDAKRLLSFFSQKSCSETIFLRSRELIEFGGLSKRIQGRFVEISWVWKGFGESWVCKETCEGFLSEEMMERVELISLKSVKKWRKKCQFITFCYNCVLILTGVLKNRTFCELNLGQGSWSLENYFFSWNLRFKTF